MCVQAFCPMHAEEVPLEAIQMDKNFNFGRKKGESAKSMSSFQKW